MVGGVALVLVLDCRWRLFRGCNSSVVGNLAAEAARLLHHIYSTMFLIDSEA